MLMLTEKEAIEGLLDVSRGLIYKIDEDLDFFRKSKKSGEYKYNGQTIADIERKIDISKNNFENAKIKLDELQELADDYDDLYKADSMKSTWVYIKMSFLL